MDEVDSNSGTVNSQITDAVTQTNVKVVANAPAQAIAQIYQAIAHATGLLAENAVNAQQQQCIVNSSGSTQGAIYLFSQNGEPITNAGSPTPRAAPDTQARGAEPANLEADVQKTALQLKQLAAEHSSINSEILESIEASQRYSLGAADAFAHAHRVSIEALVEGLEKVSAAEYRQQLQAVQLAATTVCLNAMLKSPERLHEYVAVLDVIRQLG